MKVKRRRPKPEDESGEDGIIDTVEPPESWAETAWAPKLTDWPKLSGDWMVANDFHIPFHRADVCELICETAKRLKIRRLLVAGDFFDFARLSPFAKLEENPSVQDELRTAAQVIYMFLKTFDRIYLLNGTHDVRFARMLGDEIQPNALLAGALRDWARRRVSWTKHPYCEVTSAGVKWWVVHPANYSRVPAKAALNLCYLRKANVAAAHCHIAGKVYTLCGTYTAVGLPCCTDEEKTPYLMYKMANFPVWQKGFAVLRDGDMYLYDERGRQT